MENDHTEISYFYPNQTSKQAFYKRKSLAISLSFCPKSPPPCPVHLHFGANFVSFTWHWLNVYGLRVVNIFDDHIPRPRYIIIHVKLAQRWKERIEKQYERLSTQNQYKKQQQHSFLKMHCTQKIQTIVRIFEFFF